MDMLTIDNIDNHFSNNLLALMGEWVTYHVIGPENGVMFDKVPTIRDFFETGRISAVGAFSDMRIDYASSTGRSFDFLESLLKSYGIIEECHDDIEGYPYLKPIVAYDDVRSTFLKNLRSPKMAIFPWFVDYSSSYLPETEFVAFSCDEECRPLIEAFCAEGYIARKKETFSWTPKIRFIMEFIGQWRTEKELHIQARDIEEAQQVISILDRLYEEAFQESLDNESLMPVINFVKQYPTIISFSASQELNQKKVTSVIPILGLVMLFGRLLPRLNPDTVAEDLSESSEAIKTLRRSEFGKVIELFRPEQINPDAKRDEPSKAYSLKWYRDNI